MPDPIAAPNAMHMPPTSEAPVVRPLTRVERVRALRGKYAWIPCSSEDYIREKRGEFEQEEH